MANTYSQIYLHFVFAVSGRRCLVPKIHKEELHKFITAVVQRRNCKMLAIHCMPDHIHIFSGLKPSVIIPDLVKEIKTTSNEFINQKKWTNEKFYWQEGYGVFSYGHSQIDRVCKYILNQEAHHQKRNFTEEYKGLLEKFSVSYEERYLFNQQ